MNASDFVYGIVIGISFLVLNNWKLFCSFI